MKLLYAIFQIEFPSAFALCSVLLVVLICWIFNLRHKNLKLEQHNRRLVQDRAVWLDFAQEKKHFVSLLAHELRSPLALARFNTENLIARKDLAPEDKQDLVEIDQALTGMEELLLKIVQVENMDEPLSDTSKMRLDEVIETSIAQYKGLAQSKQVEIEWDRESDQDFEMFGDPDLVGQIVNNLLSNAIKFSSSDQTVWVSLESQGDKLEIKVKDQGLGIAEAEQALVFQKYYWKKGKARVWPESMGLGLYLVKWFVERLKGEIRVHSAQGEGAVFMVTLPRTKSSKV